ncbi:hypothetical protein [Vibrio splendidus]|uniref:hypothetical protein n=1 Tax=Vibrio splendidus TaxID=29497 RepID=UPI000C84FB5E|nr:hypothetical protein [Vibrio splendidus]PMI49583.1 hypothetical protein BCU42_14410 [Vibrio splendidus]
MIELENYRRLDFIVSTVKLWDDLNGVLQQPLALEHKFSVPIGMARLLIHNINHQNDVYKHETKEDGFDNQELATRCPEALRIRELSNSIKHIETKTHQSEARINKVVSEVVINDDSTYSFLQNKIYYERRLPKSVVFEEFELLTDLYRSILFWAKERAIDLSLVTDWQGIQPGAQPKFPSIIVDFIWDKNMCLHMGSQNIQLVKFDGSNYVPTTHPFPPYQIRDKYPPHKILAFVRKAQTANHVQYNEVNYAGHKNGS